MDLGHHSIHAVIHPTAAFHPSAAVQQPPCSSAPPVASAWCHSPLNPKNRIDSLDVPLRPLWRIDGCTAFGTQFYAIPLFLPRDTTRPYRVDVFIPEATTLSSDLRTLLDLDTTLHTHDGRRIASLAISRHIVRILHHWTSCRPEPLDCFYDKLPFGSRIVVLNMPHDAKQARITLVPTHGLERQLLSVSSLRRLWGSKAELPPTLDIQHVTYVSQLHDSVCLVRVNGSLLVLKALTSHTKYLYHELRNLVSIPPHANVMTRPKHLVTKRCAFGNKVAVIGFTLHHHCHGSLAHVIPFLQLHSRLSLSDKLRWSYQVASALRHLRHAASMFYPDLRLDNIVLSEDCDAIMVDFEQRGVWCEFAAPEVNAIEYVRLLAVDDIIDLAIRQRYARLMEATLPGWQSMVAGEDYAVSSPPSASYNVSWSCLSPIEQEACEVYMLGRVLWCIFEATSAPQRCTVWRSYPWEPAVEFPNHTALTPLPIRSLIRRCTRGARPSLGDLIVRKQTKLVLRRHQGTSASSTPQQVQNAARAWWATEIQHAEKWLRSRNEGIARGDWNHNYSNRPSLRQVCHDLDALRLDTIFQS